MASARTNPQRRPVPGHGPRPRSLRIGIILGGKIVEERLIRKRETVSIGQSAKNEFSVPVEGLPRTWPLFMVKDNRYYLYFSQAMDGRISDGDQVHPLSTLKGHGAQQHGEGWVVPLAETARGKIVLGEMTLLFQFVTAPPLQPRPHLPASVRGTLADRIDPQLAIIVAASITIHFVIFTWARFFHDPPKARVDKVYDETVVEYERTAAVADFEPKPEKGAGDKADEKPKVDDKTTKKPGKKHSTKATGGKDVKKPAGPSEEELAERAALEVGQMFAEDESETGETGSMRDRNPGNKLSEEIAAVEEGDRKVELSKGSDDRLRRGKKDGRATTTGPKIKTGKTGADTGKVGPAKVVKKPKVTIKRPSVDEKTTVSPKQIMDKIRRQYTHGLKQCFKKVLLVDDTAGGTIKLKFKVGARGNITRAKVTGFGFASFDSCVKSKVMGWRFPPPKDEDGEPAPMVVELSMPFVGR